MIWLMSSLFGTCAILVLPVIMQSSTKSILVPKAVLIQYYLLQIYYGTNSCAILVLSAPCPFWYSDSRLCVFRYQKLCFKNALVGPVWWWRFRERSWTQDSKSVFQIMRTPSLMHFMSWGWIQSLEIRCKYQF